MPPQLTGSSGSMRCEAKRPIDVHAHLPAARATAWRQGRVATRAATLETPSAPTVVPDDALSYKQSIVDAEAKYVLQTYARPPELVITHGHGCKVYDVSGKEYIDFSGGIAVNCLGHSDARWLDTVTQQAGQLTHTSNLYHTIPHVQLAERLVTTSFADKAFFCNSGAEANEAAIKFARKYARQQAGVEYQDPNESAAPSTFVAFTGSFHGRTMGAVALTAKTQYQYPFAPIMPGVKQVPFLDLDAASQAITKGETCAVFVEPVQGEGGVTPATADFLRGLRTLCNEAGALLVFDEVQCGLGRTGKLWGHQHADIEPDILTAAKPLAGGLPIGAVLMKEHVANAMAPGDHGSTFAGNPLVCAAGVTVFDIVSDPPFLQEVTRKGEKLRYGLRNALADCSHVTEVRGSGLLVGVQLDKSAADVVKTARNEGVLVITAGAGDVIRLAPPLICLDEEIDVVVEVVANAIKSL